MSYLEWEGEGRQIYWVMGELLMHFVSNIQCNLPCCICFDNTKSVVGPRITLMVIGFTLGVLGEECFSFFVTDFIHYILFNLLIQDSKWCVG